MARRSKEEEPEDAGLDRPTGIERQGPPYVQISFQLPAFYMRVLEAEAKVLSQHRSTLLELLVLRKSGVIKLERAASAPSYRPDRHDLHVVKRYVWHCRPEIKERFDELRERVGNIPPRSWVILALNEWIGLPAGVSDLGDDDDAPTEIAPVRKQPSRPPSLPTRRTPR